MENIPSPTEVSTDVTKVDSASESFAIHKSRAALAMRLGLTVFLLDTAFALVIMMYVSLTTAPAPTAFLLLLLILHTAKYLIITYIALRLFSTWGTNFYEVRQGQLYILEGFTQVTESAYDLSQLGQVDIRQDWVGRRLDYGHLDLHMAGPGGLHILILSDIRHPNDYALRLGRHLRTTRFVRSRQ